MWKQLKLIFEAIYKNIVVLLVIIICGLLILVGIQHTSLSKTKQELESQQRTVNAALSDVHFYKVRDSLSAAQVSSLELTLSQYKKYHEDDAKLISELQADKKHLSSITASQAKTINELKGKFKDTTIVVVYKDSAQTVPARTLDIKDRWFELHGVEAQGEFTGTFTSYEELLVVSSLKYKRFLGFLWYTKKLEDSNVDIVSKNPHTVIESVESTIIRK